MPCVQVRPGISVVNYVSLVDEPPVTPSVNRRLVTIQIDSRLPLGVNLPPRRPVGQGIPSAHGEVNVISVTVLARVLDLHDDGVALSADAVIAAHVGDLDEPAALRRLVLPVHPFVAEGTHEGVVVVPVPARAGHVVLGVDGPGARETSYSGISDMAGVGSV